MSISAALSNALSGLGAAGRRAEVVSSNIANAATPGYAPRVAELTSASIDGAGAGVRVARVRRDADALLVADRRLADAAAGAAATGAEALVRVERAAGAPDDASSLVGRLAAFEAALVSAAANPASEARLADVGDAAAAVAASFGATSDAIQAERARADAAIAADVETLNGALARVSELNGLIRRSAGGSRDVNTLIDQRQQAIDAVAAIVPIRSVERSDGRIALFTQGGLVLVDSAAREVGFTPATTMAPAMTLAGGALSGLSVDGRPAPPSALAGGRIGAALILRDETLPAMAATLDRVAADLLGRLEAADATLPPGAAGLLTDAGAALDPAATTGLAGRLTLNAAVDPAAGGALWRLRDGIGAPAPGLSGNAAGLLALADGLAAGA
ncbi:MAG: flagellar hook-associated protein FlgK, partial [Rhodobacteraceae bacterium]|nr:flagellar hook-associated protein FlgK [Paracoccaceae bacterium]